MTEIKTTAIPRRQRCIDKEHPYIGGAKDIYDDANEKNQETINSELIQAIGTGGSVDSRIDNKINALDASVSKTAGADGLALSVTEVDGKVTQINGSIASETYAPYDTAAYLGDDDGSAIIPSFDPETDTLHKVAQVLTTAQKDQVAENLNNRGTSNGMGRIELKATDNFKTVVEAQTSGNTVFVIKYDFTLSGDVTIPANCVLEFDGGSILDNSTHTLTGTNTLFSGNIKCLVTIAGTFANDYLDVTWFGAIGDDDTDCQPVFVNISSVCIANSIDMYIPEGIFAFKSSNLHISGQYNAGTDISKYLDCNNITIKGVFGKSVIKQYSRGDVINLSWIKNLHIKDISITSGVVGIQDWGGGNNMISVVDAINVFIEGCYIHDAYWIYHKNTTNNQYYFDGGKGITIQGELYENIRVVNCDIENCVWGLDINPHGSHFYNSEKSFIYASNINITKCNTGVLVHAYNYTVGENTVLNGLMSIQARVTDCLKALSSNYTAGANIIIEATSNQSVAELLNSGYGTPWTQSVSYAESEDNDMLCIAAILAAPRNSNISVNAHYKEANYGFYISPRTEGRSGNLYKFSGNVLNLNLSPEVEIVPVVTEQEITTESKIYFYTNPNYNQGPANGNIINVNGCDLNYTTIHTVFFPLNSTNDNIIISDGIAYQRTSFVQEIKGIRDNALGGEAGSLKVINGIFSFKKFVSSASSAYPVVAFVDNNNIAHTFMCGDGSIGKDYVRDDAIKNALMGGKGIRVRLSSNWTGNPEGYIPVYTKNKGTTDERNALTLTADDSGLTFYDKTLNKPLWWTGSAWVDATGTPV